MERIGFVGLGRMGSPMASRILSAGYSLQVFDVRQSAMDDLRAAGAQVVRDLSELVESTDVVVVMVPARQVESVLCGESSVLSSARSGLIVIDGGNSDPAVSARVAEGFARAGAEFLDVGFSGGPSGAAAGTLSVMVGGTLGTFRKAEPLLKVLGEEIVYLGPSGSGHLAKALNHIVVGLTSQAIGEALAIAESSGLDTGMWLRAASGGAAASWLMSKAVEMQKETDFSRMDRWWTALGARTQFSYVLEAAERAEESVPLVALGHQLRTLSLRVPRSSSLQNYVKLTWTFSNSEVTSSTRPGSS